jgi:hypothetical protein
MPYPITVLTTERGRQRLPMIELVSWPPAGRLEQRIERARHVHEAVAHQEEHGEQGGEFVDVA